ncbi:hypothetical protein [Tenacibaculum aquimarinum]|uniref:hypothetical protein n=1 Tax=Tenacibaculum aquimarinum TaxID=2910675 RepID=UPI001F0A0673|nr:hypothetical protein [Tenacibaculum aquimarinum]MCH3883390.1 hypothetical protein [Tenacibaculum aquimarinum]
MVYINPIEILELKDKEVNEIDSSIIKKSKRRLFADIDLSDSGFYEYNGQKLTKSDCERAIEELEDKNKIEFYSHLSTNIELNKFLANGSNELLNSLKQESIYKLPDFVDFISPFFSAKIDHILLKSFQNKDLELFSSALRAEYLISKNDLNKAYKSLGNEIQQRITATDKLTNEIKEEESNYTDDNIDNVINVIQNRFPSEFLNKLPIYFQSQINKIAASINFLQLNVWNEFNTTSVPLSLLEYLLELNIESVSKPTFEKNYNIVKKKHEERIEQEKNAPLIKEWAKILISIQSKVDDVENETLKANDALSFVKSSFDLSELNNLPSFANEIRTQIGYSIRSMSIASWNKQSDIKNALALINYSLSINVNETAKSKFQQDKNELEELEKKYKGVLVCHFCETNAPDKGCEIHTTIYKETSRSYFPRRVQFSYSDVTVPRCRSCKEIHSKGSSNYSLAFFGLLILGVIIGALTEGEHFVIGGIIGAVVGWIVGKSLEGNQVKKGGIKDSSESTLSRHPLLIERIKGGYTFSKPSA